MCIDKTSYQLTKKNSTFTPCFKPHTFPRQNSGTATSYFPILLWGFFQTTAFLRDFRGTEILSVKFHDSLWLWPAYKCNLCLSVCLFVCLSVSLSLRFKGYFSRWTWVSGYKNVSILDPLELRTMEVVVTTGATIRIKLQSNHHHQQTNTQLHTGRLSIVSPNQRCQSTEGMNGNINSSLSV